MLITVIRLYCRVIHTLVAFIGKSVAYVMPLLAFVVAFEVFARYFLNKPTIWAYDVSLFMFGYIAALGGAYAQQQRAHINVDILYQNVKPRLRHFFDLISYVLAIFFVVIIFKMSSVKLAEAIEFNYRRQSEWGPHMHHYWIMMMVASLLLILQFSSDWFKSLYFCFTGQSLLPDTLTNEEDA
jgi:TRAP-type mannitol/chloroaromatic compound transport system permease small subunit